MSALLGNSFSSLLAKKSFTLLQHVFDQNCIFKTQHVSFKDLTKANFHDV